MWKWKCEAVDVWKCGGGDVKMWRCGCVEMWMCRCGDMKMWICGVIDAAKLCLWLVEVLRYKTKIILS